MNFRLDSSKDSGAIPGLAKGINIWLYISAAILCAAFLFVFISYSFFLFSNSDTVVIGGLKFVYSKVQYAYIAILIFYAFFLILYFLMSFYAIEKEKRRSFKDWIGITGFILSFLAFPAMLFAFAGIFCWIGGAVLSLYGLNRAVKNNNIAKLAFTGALFSAFTLFIIPYCIVLTVFVIFPER